MGTIICEGEEPFDLVLQQPATVHYQDGVVTLVFPVFAAGMPEAMGHIRLPLPLPHATALVKELKAALETAQRS